MGTLWLRQRIPQSKTFGDAMRAVDGGIVFQTIHRHLPPTSIPTPPGPPPHFVGREELLKQLKATLEDPESPPVLAIQGMGGVGKSALVRKLASRLTDYFSGGIFWNHELTSHNNDAVVVLNSWAAMCGHHAGDDPQESADQTALIVSGLLQGRIADHGPVLAIADGVDMAWTGGGIRQIQKALPAGVPLLITTRQTRVVQQAGATPIRLGSLERPESEELLKQLSDGRIAKEQRDRISDVCGDMPLALDLVNRQAIDLPIDEVIRRLERKRLDLIDRGAPDDKALSVRLTFDVSYDDLTEREPRAAKLLRFLAAFDQPAFVISRHFVPAGGDVLNWDVDEMKDHFYALSAWSLLKEDALIGEQTGADKTYYRLHTLLHDYIREKLENPEERKQAQHLQQVYCLDFINHHQQFTLRIDSPGTIEYGQTQGQLLLALEGMDQDKSRTDSNPSSDQIAR